MNVLDIFSGIGAFSLGLERAGMHTVAFCECDSYCRRVLAKHWPETPCYDDVRSLTADRLRADGISVDVICGGFPCQDISRAGTQLGMDGDRSGLWREFARLIRQLRPSYALVENVAALLDGPLGTVLGDLSECGYDAEWSTVSACALGATHMRQRVFVVAYPNGVDGRQGLRHTASQSQRALQAIDSLARSRAGWRARLAHPSELYGGADGLAFGMERNRAIGNSLVPQIPELIGRAILDAR